MDGAENSLAAAGQLFHKVTDGPGGLAVEAGGGFVEEEEELGFGG